MIFLPIKNYEGDLNESLYFQKVERARINGTKNK